MLVEYNLKTKIIKRGKNKIDAQDIIEALVNGGWSLFSEGDTIIYTDVSDGDNFNFVSRKNNRLSSFMGKVSEPSSLFLLGLQHRKNPGKKRNDCRTIPVSRPVPGRRSGRRRRSHILIRMEHMRRKITIQGKQLERKIQHLKMDNLRLIILFL